MTQIKRKGAGGAMAVTQGHGNPKWTRDETLLALNLYQRLRGQVPGSNDSEVIALSQRLRALPVHQGAAKRDSFRNPDGVAFKLQNIRQVATGRGLGNVSALDKAIWQEFGERPELVQRLVDAIGAAVERGEADEMNVAAIDDDEVFAEGRVLTALHRTRERNRKVRGLLLDERQQTGTLHCDCCGAGPKASNLELALAGFEAHHVTPLAESTSGGTRLTDLALLCATCHRLIHRAMHVHKRWIGVAELKAFIESPA
ncbi:HNH endonuclease [Roseateles terrae]|uniref:5-methylcytosine-specific restriction protein A n=1 Tax=Roseateles terrae TaxID=431060 RepID=A0ABR6GUK1_9BURK|nr:HNH endonuclease [Roseateles terrae]MBB3195787.1 5-methylcytosine-specific restriction protein A [Roseateles terrae]